MGGVSSACLLYLRAIWLPVVRRIAAQRLGSCRLCPFPSPHVALPCPMSLPCTRFHGKFSIVVRLNIAGRVQRRGPGREAAPHEQVALRPRGLRALRQTHGCAVETSAQPALSLLGTWGNTLALQVLLREPLNNDQLCFRWALAPLLECSSRIFHPPQ